MHIHTLVKKSLFLCSLAVSACSKSSPGPAETAAPVRVQVTATTAADSLHNGVDLQPSYYNGGNPAIAWELMKLQTKIRTVRIEIEPNMVSQAKTWISQARANGLTVIATYHKASVLGSDKASDLMDAANWWAANYVGLGANFTINLMNEWGSHNISASAYATDYNAAIAVVRTVYKGAIIIDIPGWGQETYTAYQACKTSTPLLTDANIILSAHIYPGAWNGGRNHTFQASDLDDITKSGLKGIIGEFGNGTTGTADWSACVDYAKTKGWPVLGWCWNGDGGTMNMVDPSWAVNSQATSFTLGAYFSVVYTKL